MQSSHPIVNHLYGANNHSEIRQYDNWSVCHDKLLSNYPAETSLISYFYLGNHVITLNFTEESDQLCIQDIYVTETSKCFTIIDSSAPYSTLLNYYISSSLAGNIDQDSFRKHVFNYLQGPMSDYLDYKLGHGLIIANMKFGDIKLKDALFENSLFPILKHEGIHYSLLRDHSIWLRDYVIALGSGVQLIHEEKLINDESFTAAEKIAASNTAHHLSLSRKWPNDYKSSLGGACTSNDTSECTARLSIRKLCQNNDVSYHTNTSILEGGNIMTLTKDDKPFVIIGKNLRYLNAKIHSQHKLKNNDEVMPCDLKNAGIGIEKELLLPSDRILWLKNYEYHIDLYISIGPNNVIFMHNNKLTAALAEKEYINTGSYIAFNVMRNAQTFEKAAGDILESNKSKLIRNGFKVVDVPGIGYHYNAKNTDNPYEMIINLMNGYSGQGKNGNFIITLSSCIQTISHAFETILKENGVDNVYFIGETSTVKKILIHDGSLRCMSIPGSVIFGHLGSLYGCHQMLKNTADDTEIFISNDESSNDDSLNEIAVESCGNHSFDDKVYEIEIENPDCESGKEFNAYQSENSIGFQNTAFGLFNSVNASNQRNNNSAYIRTLTRY